jgi:predicted ribosomally synthesized peptide with SipW-like signal peptide
MKFRFLAMIGVMSLAGLSLVGAGAHAVFTQNTSSVQPITAGSLNVVLSTTVAGAGGNGTATLTFPNPALTGSSYMVADPVTITNNSNIPVTEVALQLTDPDNVSNGASAALDTESWACIYSDGDIFVNETMPTVEGYGQSAILGTIAAGGTDSYTIVFYAGTSENTGCGATFTGIGPSYGGYSNAYWTTEPYPTGTTNSAAASLNSDAEGGTIDPTLTLTYNG